MSTETIPQSNIQPIKPEDIMPEAINDPIDPEVAEGVGEVAVSSTLDTLRSPEAIEKRVREALAKVDFEETPQMKEALTQYFETNYALASTIDKSIAEDPKTLSEEQKTERVSTLPNWRCNVAAKGTAPSPRLVPWQQGRTLAAWYQAARRSA